MAKRSYEIDMCNGPILGKLLRFSLPLMLSGVLQLLFNAADIVVVGRFSGSEALAAVGSTGSLINLLINVFIGLSIGTNVLVAQYYGAKDVKNLSDTVHTSVAISLASGAFLIFLGFFAAPPLLRAVDFYACARRRVLIHDPVPAVRVFGRRGYVRCEIG